MASRAHLRFLRAALLSAVLWHGCGALAQGTAPDPAATAASAVASPAAITSSGAPTAPTAADTLAAGELASLRADLQAQRELVRQLRQRQADADSASHWLPWVGLGLVFSLGLAGWFGLRLAQTQRNGRQPRAAMAAELSAFDAASTARKPAAAGAAPSAAPKAGAPATPLADAGSGLFPGSSRGPSLGAPTTLAGAMATYGSDTGTLTRPAVATPRAALTVPASANGELSLTGHEPRDVTVEELLDLEQQVDFFMVLGQEDAAIDLLVGHIRSTGGTSPLPYLKLLEVYRQQGQAEAYERTRSRFNLRFNAYAPDWEADLEAGRLLEDYPGVVERLQRLWAAPLDAMAELEALLFRRQEGELFELPAYRELLLLYAVARDLDALAPAPAQRQVDVLLPLDDDLNDQDTTSPRPHLGLFSDEGLGGRTGEWARLNERPAVSPGQAVGDRTVTLRSSDLPPPRIDLDMALDIDLGQLTPPPREFTQPAGFSDVDLSSSDFADLDDSPQPLPTTPSRRG
ncbi:hypothetical protein AACH10_18330 [Ideonella sp. DXS22W]|uniref:Uncharacterized protein n=1 Tax=Pseudaquabacterium inlustre TaxID=2984192 RepID=A0ABU9CNJ5_9BURK